MRSPDRRSTATHATLVRQAGIALIVGGWLFVPANAQQGTGVRRTVLPSQERVTLATPTGTTLVIRGVVADILITRASGPDVVLTAAVEPQKAAPVLEMVRDDATHRLTICTVYPSPNPKKPNECASDEKSRLAEGVTNGSAGIRFEVELPDGVNFVGLVTRGRIIARAGASDLRLRSGLGDVSLDDSGKGTLDAAIELRGTLIALVAAGDGGPRKVRLDVASGKLKVAVPSTIPIDYTIFSDRPPLTRLPLEKVGTMWRGTLGSSLPGQRLNLRLNAGGMSELELVPRP